MADLNGSQMSESTISSEKEKAVDNADTPPWSLWVVFFIGGFFGPVAAALITYFNFKKMGQPEKAKWTIGLTLIGVVIYSIYITEASQRDAESISSFIGNIISPILYPAILWKDFKKWELEGSETYSGWKAIGWGILGSIIFLLMSFTVIIFLS